MLRNGHKLIGFAAHRLDDEIVDFYINSLYKEIVNLQYDFVPIIGNSIKSPDLTKRAEAFVFDLIDPNLFDGLIIWGSAITTGATPEEQKKFFRKFISIPVVNIGSPVPGVLSLLIDNEDGISKIMEHLINGHGLTKIAFIRGPRYHYATNKRFTGYLDSLKKYNLPANTHLITPHNEDFSKKTGEAAIHYLLDKKKLRIKKDIEAIVTCSDVIAYGAVIELQRRRIQVPNEIVVTGFNNKDESLASNPRLTTVDPQFGLHGGVAVSTIIKLMDGEKLPAEILVPTKLIIRESCGCVHESALQKIDFHWKENPTTLVEKIQEIDHAELNEIEKISIKKLAEMKISSLETSDTLWREKFVHYFCEDLKHEASKTFIKYFLSLVMANDNVGEAILYGQTLLAELHNLVLTRSHDKRIALKAAILLQEANYQINEVINVNSANLEIEVTDRLNVINHLSLEFLNNFNIDELLPMLIKHLPYLKISGCYIALFTNQQTNYDKLRKEACDELRKEACDELRKETCDTVHLILAYKDNQALPLEQLDSIYPAKKILPDKYLNPDKTNSFVILPLCFQSHKLGIIVFEMENSINKYWLILTKQLCNVIEGSFLVKEKETLLKEINEKNTAINETLNSLWGEMELAKKIQVSILPKTQQLEGFQVSPYLRPSEEVSGNYYDIIALPDSTYWLIIADVTEHGILTGLITMMLQTSISNTINIRADITARELLCAVNKTVFNTLKKRLLLNHSIKACFIRFNPEGNLEIAGTGQDILIYRKMSRRVEKITAKGKWLSITENIEKDTDSLSGHMDPADVLCVYSDELTDLKNTHQESFGINNIIRILEENGHKEADEITEALTAGLRQFKGYQNDDITFIILKKI